MTFVWILCIWTVAGVPLGMLVGSLIANLNAEAVKLPARDAEIEVGLEMPVCS